MAEIKKTTEETPVQEQGTYLSVEDFFMKNRNIIVGSLAVIVIGIGGYFGYKKLYMEPRVADAQNTISGAQNYFMKDSIDLALNGDGSSMGFLGIIDQYGNTPTGNLAHYYAGVCYMKNNDIDNAIKQLESYKPGTDEIAGKTYELLGHLYADKKEYKKAIDLYIKAGESANNNLQSPSYYKFAGDLMAEENDIKGALEMYRKIKQLYPLSPEGMNIDSDISYAETKLGE